MGSALLVAHPGHELRVHGWLERQRPLVFVLTDGSGSRDAPRIEATRDLLAAVGARPGSVFGRLSDRRLYRALLECDHELFAALGEEIAQSVAREGVDTLAGDAAEGFNPSHDVARLLANAVVARLRGAGRPIESLDFPLDAAPGAGGGDVAVRLELDERSFERKMSAARAYAGLAAEVEAALARFGPDAFRVELLRRADPGFGPADHDPVPRYERFGEERKAQGVYRDVIRYRDHVRPLAAHLEARFARDQRT